MRSRDVAVICSEIYISKIFKNYQNQSKKAFKSIQKEIPVTTEADGPHGGQEVGRL